MASNQVLIKFAGDSSSLESALGRLDAQTGKTQSKMQRFGRTAKIVSAAVLGGLAVAFKAGFDELKAAQQVTAQTDNALAKFGGTTAYTTKQVQDLAGALLQKTGVDDEAIQSISNLYLANENFRKGIGASLKGVEAATTAALDWSAATGKDSTAAAMALNKALANPTKGIALLEKAGVSFTKAEKDRIKAMQEAGNVAGAQNEIIKKLTGSFGGAAQASGKTLAGQLNVAKESFLNMSASVVSALLPALEEFASILSKLAGFLSQHETLTKVLVGAIAGLAIGVWAVGAAVKAWTAVQIALNFALSANPIGAVVLVIAALAAGVIYAYQKSETFRSIVTGAFDAVAAAARAVASAISRVIDFIGDLYNNKAIRVLATVLAGPFIFALTHINSVVSAIKSVVSWVKSAIGLVGKLKSILPGVGNGPGGSFNDPGSKVRLGGGIPPKTAHGGIVTGPQVRLVGEAGPEAIIPLSNPRSGRMLGGGSVTVNVYDRTTAGMSPEQRRRLAEDLAPELRRALAVA